MLRIPLHVAEINLAYSRRDPQIKAFPDHSLKVFSGAGGMLCGRAFKNNI
jgi:hypothetical protein